MVVGEKLTTSVQLAPAAKEEPHGVPPPAAAEKSPLAVNAIVADVVRLLVRVMAEEPLVVPTVQVPKLTLAGDMVIGRMPMPVASKISGLTAVLLVTAIAPWSVPVVDGLKVTVNVHEAPEARVVTQPDEV